MTDDALSIPEAARRRGVNARVLYNAHYRGQLATMMRDGRHLVALSAVDAYLATRGPISASLSRDAVPPPPPRDDYLTLGEAAARYGYAHVNALRGAARAGRLQTVRAPGRTTWIYLTTPEWMEEYRARRPSSGTTRAERGVREPPHERRYRRLLLITLLLVDDTHTREDLADRCGVAPRQISYDVHAIERAGVRVTRGQHGFAATLPTMREIDELLARDRGETGASGSPDAPAT